MAYSIHIERLSEDGSPVEPPLSLDEWKSTIKNTDGLRLNSKVKSVTNPNTGQVLSIGGRDGDAEMLVDEEWLPVFRWSDGRVSFNAASSFVDASDPVRQMATSLAAGLSARVVGDEGEFYN